MPLTAEEKEEIIKELEWVQKRVERDLDRHEGLEQPGHYEIQTCLQDIVSNLITVVDLM